MLNTIVGSRYRLEEKLGSGQMSSVFRASDVRNPGQEVVVKLLNSAHPDDIRKELFRRETEALQLLQHPNIVNMISRGIEPDGGYFYLVLESLHESLEARVRQANSEPMHWTSVGKIMADLADGLAHAHSAGVVHRDIKPANVLFGRDNSVKLVDFGISRLINELSIGVTLAHFWSSGFASPEQRSGQPGDQLSDIYSLGMVAISLLTGKEPLVDGYPSTVLSELEGPRELVDLLVSTLSVNPSERPRNAVVLRDGIRKIVDRVASVPIVFIEMPQSALRKLADAGLITRPEFNLATDWLISEYGGDELSPISFQITEREAFRILGSMTSLFCRISDNRQSLIVTEVDFPPSTILAAQRTKAYLQRIDFHAVQPQDLRRAGPEELRDSQKSIEGLASGANKHRILQSKKAQQSKHQRDRIDDWERFLAINQRAISNLRGATKYNSYQRIGGRTIRFVLESPIPENLQWSPGESLSVSTEPDGREFSVGEIVEANGFRIDAELAKQEEQIPPHGYVGRSVRELATTLARQSKALKKLRFAETANPNLPLILADVSQARFDLIPPVIEFKTRDLDADKRQAVQKALAARDIFLIQGPPGTGKTTVIAEIIQQIFAETPEARILVSSQSNVPVNHVLSRLETHELQPYSIVRVGRKDKVGHGAEQYLLDSLMATWAQDVVAKCRETIRELRAESRQRRRSNQSKTTGLRDEEIEQCEEWLQEADAALFQLESQQDSLADLSSDLFDLSESIRREILDQEIASQCTIAIAREDEIRGHIDAIRSVLPDHLDLASSTPREQLDQLRNYLQLASTNNESSDPSKAKIKLLEDWCKVFGKTEEFARPLLSEANIIAATCLYAGNRLISDNTYDLAIIDEAARATATELLVAMVRAKKIILVGDERQLPPMVVSDNLGIDPTDQAILRNSETSLFEILAEEAHKNRNEAISNLTTQRRMHPAIGNLVSKLFYDSSLHNGVSEEDRLHGIEGIPSPVTWVSTSRMPSRDEIPVATTYMNECEAHVIHKLLETIEHQACTKGKRKDVGLIAPYSGQTSKLLDVIRPEDTKRWQALNIEIATVDAFQGRDRDIIVYSTVRSNTQGTIGFLADRRRLNVAVSRAREALIIVGDAQFFSNPSEHMHGNVLQQLLAHIKDHPGDCSMITADDVSTHGAV